MNMFGYDDDQLNQLLFALAQDPTVMVQVTLDKSQASGVHEKKILASDVAADPAAFAADFAVGQSATHQISHTKGGVLDGIVAFEGLTRPKKTSASAGDPTPFFTPARRHPEGLGAGPKIMGELRLPG